MNARRRAAYVRRPVPRLTFIRPLVPSSAAHQRRATKWDSFRFQVIKAGSDVRLYSKSSADYETRLHSCTWPSTMTKRYYQELEPPATHDYGPLLASVV